MCPLNPNPKNRIYLDSPELILNPLREASSCDFLHPVVQPWCRESRPDRMDSIYRARLRCTPTEDSLDEYIVDLLLPKLQSQPRLHAIRRLLVKYFTEALLEVRRMVTFSFGKRMQRPKSR